MYVNLNFDTQGGTSMYTPHEYYVLVNMDGLYLCNIGALGVSYTPHKHNALTFNYRVDAKSLLAVLHTKFPGFVNGLTVTTA